MFQGPSRSLETDLLRGPLWPFSPVYSQPSRSVDLQRSPVRCEATFREKEC